MCQANLPGHWLDSAPNPTERARRQAALHRLAVVRDGYKVFDGPSVLSLIESWDREFAWAPSQDRGVLVTGPDGRVIESSLTVLRLRAP